MRRVISLYLPTLATDRIRCQKTGVFPLDRPLVTIVREGVRQIVAAIDLAAYRLGVRVGDALVEVQARIPEIVALNADEKGDQKALEELARLCLRLYSPLVTIDGNGLYIDISGGSSLI